MKNVYNKMFDEDKSGFASNKDNNYSVPKADNRNSNDQNVQGSLNFQMNKMINNQLAENSPNKQKCQDQNKQMRDNLCR